MRFLTMRRQSSAFGALLAAVVLLAGCSSQPEPAADEASTPTTSAESTPSESGEPAPAPEATPTTTEPPAPASTAQQPVAHYPDDPNIDPTVELGPPPPAYETPRPECPVEAKACIDLTNNMTWIQVQGTVVYGPVQHIAGRPGYRTTPGMHTVTWKNIDHVSSIFHTPMPYAIFFTASGMAFHEGELNIPSHGCIHLEHEDAVAYWEHLHPGDRVYAFGEAMY